MRINRSFAILTFLIVALIAAAENNNLSVGIKAGAAYYTTDAEAKSQFGPSLGLTVNYSCLWRIGYSPVQMGLMTGLGAAWSQTGLNMEWQTQYTNIDYLGRRMQYTQQGVSVQKDRQLQFEVPLMYALSIAGFRLNIGPQFMSVLPRSYSVSLNDMNSQVDFLDFGVTLIDDAIAGKLPADRLTQTGKTLTPTLNLNLSLQVGYEFSLNDQHALGLMAYFDYGLWNNYTNATPTNRIVDVAPITNASTEVPEVTIYDLNTAFVNKVNYLSFGLRFYWNMSWDLNRMHGGHRAPHRGRVQR